MTLLIAAIPAFIGSLVEFVEAYTIVLAIGLPVVTTDAGFCADIVEHGREGFVLGPDPDSEIVEVLERFRNDPELARRMGAAGRERAEREFDSVRLFDEYRRLIAETAAS